MQNLWLFFAFTVIAFGACIGSFLNVCIYRIPLDQSVAFPGSHCMSCGKPIKWYNNIPVLSYFILRGKCADCGASFSFRYAAIELLTAFLFLLVFCMVPPVGAMPPAGIRALGEFAAPSPWSAMAPIPCYWVFIALLIIGTFVDFDHYIIPDSVTIGGMAAGLACSALVPALQARVVPVMSFDGIGSAIVAPTVWYEGLLWSAVGLAAGFLPLQLIRCVGTWWFRKTGRIGADDEAMGFGDIKLIGAIGAFLGYEAALFSIAAAALIGTLVAVPMLLLKKRSLIGRLPFGPYLSAAALLWIFYGHRLTAAYLTLGNHF